MNMKRHLTACLVVVLLFTALFSGCGTKSGEIQLVSPKMNETISLLNEEMTDFYENYEYGYSLNYAPGVDNYRQAGAILSWTTERTPDKCEVRISADKNLEDAKTFVTAGNSVRVPELLIGEKYYWQVTAFYGSETAKSGVFTFKTERNCRTIYIDGATNTRDFGGHKTKDGKIIKQGLVFRGSNIDGITATGKLQFTEVYGIKTDLDLRGDSDRTESPMGEDFNFYYIKAPLYTQIGNEDYQEALAEEIRVFTDESNYPIYFHCAIGRDRTGTLAFLLGAILGLSEEDLSREYETTMFSRYGGDDPIGMLDGNYEPLVNYIKTFAGKNIKAQAESYLMSIGITKDEINKIRSIMLE